MLRRVVMGAAIAALAGTQAAAAELEVRQSGPEGEIANLAEAREVRVSFSEPMVALGRIPEPVVASFFHIEPAVDGAFRWAGATTLIFTPQQALPYSTRYRVTIDTTAVSVAGSRLSSQHRFEFATPTVRLLRADWYRRGDRYDAPVVIALRFNQPVRPLEVARQLSLTREPHAWNAPELAPEARAQLATLDPQAVAAFDAKLQRTKVVAAARGVVAYANSTSWDTKAYPPSDDLVVIETRTAPEPDVWLHVRVGPRVPGAQGPETPGTAQDQTIQLEPTFFVDGPRCQAACDPDGYNPLRLRTRVTAAALGRALRVVDVTDPARPLPLARSTPPAESSTDEEEDDAEDHDQATQLALEDAGYSLKPARRYALSVGRELQARDGQSLGYTWAGSIENWHQRGFSSFGDGHGVWEASGGPQLPFYARNLQSVKQWLAPVAQGELMPTLRRLTERQEFFQATPEGPGTDRMLHPKPDTVQSYGLDLKAQLSPVGTGLFWAALLDGAPIAKAQPAHTESQPKATLVQVTHLGISVKDSPQSTLVFVTRLDDAAPVPGARVSIVDLENKSVWSGTTDASGLALAPDVDLRDHDNWWKFRFLVIAEKDGDVAYLGNDWTEGVEPWAFGALYDLDEARPLLRGSVFADRGVYKLGEEVHLKAILRSDTARGMALLPGAPATLVLEDSESKELAKQAIALSEWSSAEWTFKLPAEGPLGRYRVTATVDGQKRSVAGGFLVAAYRRPDFRVDANLAAESSVAGATLKGVVTGRYLFGAPMAKQAVRWTLSRSPLDSVPAAILERFPEDRYAFLDSTSEHPRHQESVKTDESALDAQGQLATDLPTEAQSGLPWLYTFEGNVTDVSRQSIAGRASFRVDPAPWYVAMKRPPYFADAAGGADTELVAVGLDGRPVAGVALSVGLTQVQWHSARRAEGGGFYTWETERREVAAGQWDLVSAGTPAPLHLAFPGGGFFILRATARDAEGHSTTTAAAFYVLGSGYTAWERFDHNRIDLVPERKSYRPGETARLMVKSPWEAATGLLTTEREGIRSYKTFHLTSTQQTVEVPLAEADIPNVYVSVLLVKGRTGNFNGGDTSDPDKPSFRLGYAELRVDDEAKKLGVAIASDREEYRPAGKAHVDVNVSDRTGAGAPAEVTLWAVDHGVLSLTDYHPPKVGDGVWIDKALQIMNEDSRQRLISRRALVPKGGDEGGGGGRDEGPGTPVRKDFRVLAFWLGSLATDAAGHAATDVALPESLTTYRIMAVAADKASRFGSSEHELRISKPVLLRPAFPRFLAAGDSAFFGAVLNSQLKEKGTAIVTMRSLDPSLLEVQGDAKKTLALDALGSAEARFTVRAKAPGSVKLQMSAKLLGEADAFEETLPVEVLVTPEVVAAYGQVPPQGKESLELPAGVVPSIGGLHLELASTALVGLGEGARYLVDYPYGCAEQRASAALALLLAADLGDAFRLPDVDPSRLKDVVRTTVTELGGFQCAGGGFSYWKGECDSASPYLTSYVLHVLDRARRLDYPVAPTVMDNGYGYLEKALNQPQPSVEGLWPAHTAWQAFAVKVLAEGGRNVDSRLTWLFDHRDKMPVFGLAYLRDALAARGESGPRTQELERRLTNAVLPEGGTAHVEELADPYLLWFWNSNVRTTAITLGTRVRAGLDPALDAAMVRWLMNVRTRGRWGNTQENAAVLESLVDYYRKYEGEVPAFDAVVKLGLETLARPTFSGRSSSAETRDVAMRDLLAKGKPGEKLDLTFDRVGTGTLYYAARLKYAADADLAQGMDQGIAVARGYAAQKDPTREGASFKAGELVEVTLTLDLTKERRFVAVTDPLPAGFEPVESWFATTARDLARGQEAEEAGGDWMDRWERGGFDHVERHDDRVLLFATRLSEGRHTFKYVVRATTAGSFRTAPAHAEEMYEPEVFGRTPSALVEVKP